MNILISMDMGTKSHIKYLLDISALLSKEGHKITYISGSYNMRHSKGYNFSTINLGGDDIDIHRVRSIVKGFSLKPLQPLVEFAKFSSLYQETYSLRIRQMKEIIDTHSPDLVICDFMFIACIDSSRYKNVPFIIGFQNIEYFYHYRSPYLSSISEIGATTSDRLSFYHRFKVKVKEHVKKYNTYKANYGLNKLRIKEGVPTSGEIVGDWKNSFKLANTYIGFDYAFHTDPTINFVGPVISETREEINNGLQKFINNQKKLVYISFGSICIVPKEHISMIIEALLKAIENRIIDGAIWSMGIQYRSDFPEYVLKDDKKIKVADFFDSETSKIRIVQWVPQVAILKHPNSKLIISHGGLESIFEASLSGIPMLVMPYGADQPRSAEKIKTMGNGDLLDPRKMKTEEIYQKIKEIIITKKLVIEKNVRSVQTLAYWNSKKIGEAARIVKSYAYYAKSCRDGIYRKNELQPCELKIFMPVSTRMPFIKAYAIDVYGSAILMISMTVYLVLNIIRKSLRILLKRNK